MKNLLKNPFFFYGNVFYLFLLLGFVLFTHPNPVILHKYSLHYFAGLVLLLVVWVPYAILLAFLVSGSSRITFGKKTFRILFPIRLLVVFFFLLVVFLITELVLRMYPKPQIADFHPFLQAISTPKNEAAWHVDSDNFRYDEITKDKPKDTYRIFVTGGSTVFDEWQPYERTMVKQVEDLLRKHYPNRKIQVINAGYLRYTSEHTLILYATKLADYHPDLVVVWQGFNDLYYSCIPPSLTTGKYKSDYSHFYAVLANVLNAYFNYQPHFLTTDLLQKVFAEKFYADLRPSLHIQFVNPFAKPVVNKPVNMHFQSLQAFTRNMNYLVKLIKSDNVAVLLGNQATMYSKKNPGYFGLARSYCTYAGQYPSDDSLIRGMAQFNAASQKIAEENDVPFVDIASQLPQTPEYMYDDVHYTGKGDTKVAEIIYHAIVDNKFLESSNQLTSNQSIIQ